VKAHRPDFDHRHGENCIFLESTLSVRLIMTEPFYSDQIFHKNY